MLFRSFVPHEQKTQIVATVIIAANTAHNFFILNNMTARRAICQTAIGKRQEMPLHSAAVRLDFSAPRVPRFGRNDGDISISFFYISNQVLLYAKLPQLLSFISYLLSITKPCLFSKALLLTVVFPVLLSVFGYGRA